MISIASVKEWFWCLLPDRCEMKNCTREGVRGNENWVCGKVMCDACTVDYMRNTINVKALTYQPDGDTDDAILQNTQKCLGSSGR